MKMIDFLDEISVSITCVYLPESYVFPEFVVMPNSYQSRKMKVLCNNVCQSVSPYLSHSSSSGAAQMILSIVLHKGGEQYCKKTNEA